MTLSKPLSTSQVRASPAQRDRLRWVEQRLANAERELRTQFTRIAQLRAELDQLLAPQWASRHGETQFTHSRMRGHHVCCPRHGNHVRLLEEL
jgi:hypothetical protein